MTPRRWLLAGLGTALLLGLTLGPLALEESCGRKKAEAAEATANEAHGRADAHQEQARQADAAAEKRAGDVQTTDLEVQRLRDRLADAKRRLVSRPKPVDVPVAPVVDGASAGGDRTPEPDGRDAVLEDAEALIAAQDKEIGALKLQVVDLTTARDAWKATAEDREREAAGLRIALDAQKKVQQASRWRGRIEGFAGGVAVGFVAGRLK